MRRSKQPRRSPARLYCNVIYAPDVLVPERLRRVLEWRIGDAGRGGPGATRHPDDQHQATHLVGTSPAVRSRHRQVAGAVDLARRRRACRRTARRGSAHRARSRNLRVVPRHRAGRLPLAARHLRRVGLRRVDGHRSRAPTRPTASRARTSRSRTRSARRRWGSLPHPPRRNGRVRSGPLPRHATTHAPHAGPRR